MRCVWVTRWLPPLPQGYLLPSYHQFYWLGLAVAEGSTWPSFTWVDHTPGPNTTSYNHWGRCAPGTRPYPLQGRVAGRRGPW